eukprot:TRINITY_DN6229_c0_g1_i2.p1 TRINITY_DN6229_c0_g1~~TRINITY_DN6229_c0_g1_i2.p1  ORF type:complete len:401 (-),score=94.85 TRINITY_DN6229_c0_g1_i2:21-1223(-)
MVASVHCLVCAKCGNPATTKANLISEKANAVSSSVYNYELTVLDEACWCYSATDVDGERVDLLRICAAPATSAAPQLRGSAPCRSAAPAAASATLFESGPDLRVGALVCADLEDTADPWFGSSARRRVHCAGCPLPTLLGWYFEAPAGGRSGASQAAAGRGSGNGAFIALLITRTRERLLETQGAKELIRTSNASQVAKVVRQHAFLAQLERLPDGAQMLEHLARLEPRELQGVLAAATSAEGGGASAATGAAGAPVVPPERVAARLRSALREVPGGELPRRQRGRASSLNPSALRGVTTRGQADIVNMRENNRSVQGGARPAPSFAALEAARARAREAEEEPWLARLSSNQRPMANTFGRRRPPPALPGTGSGGGGADRESRRFRRTLSLQGRTRERLE